MTKFYGFVQKLYVDKQLRIERDEILWWYFKNEDGAMKPHLAHVPSGRQEQCSPEGNTDTPPG